MTPANFVNYTSKPPASLCHEIQNDMHLVIQEGVLQRGENAFKHRQPMVELGFNMGGPIQFTLHHESETGAEYVVNSGMAHISVCSFDSGVIEYTKDQSINWLGIILPLNLFKSFFEFSLNAYFKGIPEDAPIMSKMVGQINAEMQAALRQIMMCRYLGQTKCLFLKSKIIELISYVSFYADGGETVNSASYHLSASDREKMWIAKKILDKNLENPPSIIELARQVAVNEFKLKNGFREVHGITPYRYVSDQRLEKAREILLERRMNVTEVALTVGYSSLSHFAKIFREKFGVTPHDYLTQAHA